MNNSGEVRRRQGDVILGSARPDRWHGDDVDAASTAASKGRNGPAMVCGTAAPTTICLVQQRLSDYVCGVARRARRAAGHDNARVEAHRLSVTGVPGRGIRPVQYVSVMCKT
jgi:hypothetical protein